MLRRLLYLIDNISYAKYMIEWLDKSGVPDNQLAQNSFELIKEYWFKNTDINLEIIRNKLWDWVDSNDGYNLTTELVIKMRIILCLAFEDNQELQNVGYFEGLLVNLDSNKA